MNFDARVEHHDLAEHIRELDEVGLTVVPRHKLELTDAFFERLRTNILRVARQHPGIEFDLETGVAGEFDGPAGKMHQFFVTHMIYEDPVFEQVLTHPVKKALMEHMLGPHHRSSVSNAWIKWQMPDSWEDPVTTSMHADQGQVPAPWNVHAPQVANMNWLLTDCSKRDLVERSR